MFVLLEEIRFYRKKHIYALSIAGVCIVMWIVVFYEAIVSAAKVWWVSEIYSHGFFILPISAYLIWRMRHELAKQVIKPAYLALIPLTAAAFIYILGEAGSIRLFQHAAIFTILPLTIWFIFGTHIAKLILFPLSFILFSIPFGEEFIPFLQRVTADMSVWLLRIVDIPVFINGLYIEIPNGKFVVAEACSGIRFLVGSAVFGALYAYISYKSKIKQFIFFIIALIVPIIANSIRVSAIVLIGYFSDMKYATGIDHLIYGWIFFAIVILLLIYIGNIWVDKTSTKAEVNLTEMESRLKFDKVTLKPILIILGLYTILYAWGYVVESNKQKLTQIVENTKPVIQGDQSNSWEPIFEGASKVVQTEYDAHDGQPIDYYSAYYIFNTPKSELISSTNRIYNPDNWTLITAKNINLELKTGYDINALLYSVVGNNQEYRYIIFWYEIGSFKTSNKAFVKIIQSFDALLSKPGSGRIVIYSTKYTEDNMTKSRENLIKFVNSYHDKNMI